MPFLGQVVFGAENSGLRICYLVRTDFALLLFHQQQF